VIGISIFVFFLLILPFLPLLFNMKLLFRLIRLATGKENFFLAPLRMLYMYMMGILFPSLTIHVITHGEIKWDYAILSILPGIMIILTIYLVIILRKKGFLECFLFYTLILFLFLSIFASVRPYHINYFLIFFIPFLFSPLLKNVKSISEAWMRKLVFISLILNFFQTILIGEDAKNSSLSLSVHKEVVEYIEKNNIERIYNLAGRYGFEFISKRKIEVLDFQYYLGTTHNPYKIGLSLLLAKDGIIMVEKYKRYPTLTTGIGIEDIYPLAKKMGLKVRILKNFPDDSNPLITLMKVE
jgi:hypothetical protein